MRHCLILLLAFACGGCAWLFNAKPDGADLDRLEHALAGRPCIGALDRWERHYRLAAGGWFRSPDYDRVDFNFLPAESMGHGPRRVVEGWADARLFYDGPTQVAFGSFDIRTGTVEVEYCGPNFNNPPTGNAAYADPT